jgi:nucleoside-diphosphate-sugar epimerase
VATSFSADLRCDVSLRYWGSGFIGRALCAELVERGAAVGGAVRRLSLLGGDSQVEFVAVGEIGAETDRSSSAADFDCDSLCSTCPCDA